MSIPLSYLDEQFNIPERILNEAGKLSVIRGNDGTVRLNLCIDYPGLTNSVKYLRRLQNKISDMECFDAYTGDRQRFFVFTPVGDVFWLHFGPRDHIIRA